MGLFTKPERRYYSADFDIEFNSCFAIERDEEAGCTVIGYHSNGVQEWHLPCSPEKHEELYQRYIAERNRIHKAHGKTLIP